MESATTEWPSWTLKYNQSPCFGQCPVYTFYLLSNNSGLIEVKANLLEPGWYHADLDQETIHDILTDIEPASWWNEDLSDEPEIADLPRMSISYKHADGLRFVEVQNRISHEVSSLFQKINHLVTESRWKSTSLRPLTPDGRGQTDVIVQLKEGVDINTWLKKYERFGIRFEKRITPRQRYYLVSKDADKGSANDFLQYIKLDEDVVDAQWDSPVTPRK